MITIALAFNICKVEKTPHFTHFDNNNNKKKTPTSVNVKLCINVQVLQKLCIYTQLL